MFLVTYFEDSLVLNNELKDVKEVKKIQRCLSQGQEVLFFLRNFAHRKSCSIDIPLQRSQRPKTFVEFLIFQSRFRIVPEGMKGMTMRGRDVLRLVIHCNSRKTVACENSRLERKESRKTANRCFSSRLMRFCRNFSWIPVIRPQSEELFRKAYVQGLEKGMRLSK